MTLFETTDMGFKEFENERSRLIDTRDHFILSCSLDTEDDAMMSEVIFYDELLLLYKEYYGSALVHYTKIAEHDTYVVDEHRYQRLKRMLVRKYREVAENLDLSEKEKFINEHIFQRAMLGLRILYEGRDILACYERNVISSSQD